MEATRLRLAGTVVLAGLAAATGVVGVTLYSRAAPYVGFLELARTAMPGLALAAAAGAVAIMRRGGTAPLFLAAASFTASAPAVGVGVQQGSAAWVPLTALGGLLPGLVVVVVLLFPAGRLAGWLAWVAAAVVLVLGISGSIVRMATYDPASWGWCECLANPLATQVEPRTYLGLVDVVTVGEMAALVIGALVLARAGLWRQRGRRSFFATYGLLVASWLLVDAWTLTAGPDVPGALTLFRDSTLVLLAVVYVLGFASQRPSRAHVADLLLAAREEHNSRRLRDLVARAMGDPETVVGWWDSRTGGYLDHRGHDVPLPDVDVLRVEAAGRAIAVVSSDRLPDVDPSVRESVVQALLLAAENRRLTAELEASLEQVRDSRARILTASDDTRRRIERDLHDGAQQLLISTGIKLNLAAAQAERGDAASLTKVIEEAQAELNRALTELRNLASGIAPTALVHGSLENALRELALRSAVPTAVRVSGEEQPDEHTAATLFFLVAECLTNVTKHSGASRATVEVALTSPIRVEVSDDGRGGATFDSSGTGLRGLVDRVEALGGRLHVASAPGGTTVSATIPAGVVETLDR